MLPVFVLLIYIAMIVFLIIGWQRIHFFHADTGSETTQNASVSVVVACHNEENNLPALIDCIKKQSFNNFEFIIVNDHSTDRTVFISEQFAKEWKQIKIINSTDRGKKSALKEGIEAATGELIVTTDADCTFGESWLSTISDFYANKKDDMIICPVVMTFGNSVFENLQSIEFTSLVAAGAGATGAKHPIMCNGAGLAFKKKVWTESIQALHFETASGDDMFLLQFIKKRKGTIGFLKSDEAKVYTKPVDTLRAFIRQRTRWTGKAIYYTDTDIITTALIVLCISATEIFCLFFSFRAFLLIFIGKFIADLTFFSFMKHFFAPEFSLRKMFLLSFIYPVYICSTVFLSLFRKKQSW